MTAASIELLAGAGALLLFRACVNMDVIWPVLHVLRQDSEARTTIFSCPEDGSLSPISPEDVLLEHGHGIWVQDPMHYYLSVLPSQSGPLNFISIQEKRCSQKTTLSISPPIMNCTYNEASAQ